jgi:hypothetical protein
MTARSSSTLDAKVLQHFCIAVDFAFIRAIGATPGALIVAFCRRRKLLTHRSEKEWCDRAGSIHLRDSKSQVSQAKELTLFPFSRQQREPMTTWTT